MKKKKNPKIKISPQKKDSIQYSISDLNILFEHFICDSTIKHLYLLLNILCMYL